MRKNIRALLTVFILLLLIGTAEASVVIFDLPDVQPILGTFNTSGEKLLIACGSPDYNLIFYDVSSGEFSTLNTDQSSDNNKARPTNIIPIHELGYFAVSNGWINTVSFIDMNNGQLIADVEVGEMPTGLAGCNLKLSFS